VIGSHSPVIIAPSPRMWIRPWFYLALDADLLPTVRLAA